MNTLRACAFTRKRTVYSSHAPFTAHFYDDVNKITSRRLFTGQILVYWIIGNEKFGQRVIPPVYALQAW